eukprot:Gregarina_sp_Poly_1__2009@NODE_1527_length_3924_cov_82_479907_g1010_i0_p4_GENE_NODE_1527_length_3924_cov_82_479907_g1010_i0NODE_1527_length_3924_cov_82_479907_g1010_i0_p4_ORF_typecomplete_len197_score31_59Magobind/PF09282_10/2_6e13_NODE_1527_length_3924_cov_82_479907_g1010_i04721062
MSRALVPPNVVVERSGAGETYIINEKGEKLIAASRRADGSIRKPIKVRPGFMPLEERERFVSRGSAIRRGIEHSAAHPPGAALEDTLVGSCPTVSPKKARKKKSPKKQSEAYFEIVEDIPSVATHVPEEGANDYSNSVSATKVVEEESAALPDDLEGVERKMKLTRRKLMDARTLERKQGAGQHLLPNQEEVRHHH